MHESVLQATNPRGLSFCSATAVGNCRRSGGPWRAVAWVAAMHSLARHPYKFRRSYSILTISIVCCTTKKFRNFLNRLFSRDRPLDLISGDSCPSPRAPRRALPRESLVGVSNYNIFKHVLIFWLHNQSETLASLEQPRKNNINQKDDFIMNFVAFNIWISKASNMLRVVCHV